LSHGDRVRGDVSALLVVEMLNTYEHEDAGKLVASVAAGECRLGTR